MIAQYQPEADRWATCAFCGMSMKLGDAIDAGWIPEFYDADVCHSCPTCPACIDEHLQRDSDGEMELKPGHSLPEDEQ